MPTVPQLIIQKYNMLGSMFNQNHQKLGCSNSDFAKVVLDVADFKMFRTCRTSFAKIHGLHVS